MEPNGVNAIPSLVRGWLDSRAADQDRRPDDTVTAAIPKAARADAAAARRVDLVARPQESFTPVVEFDARPARRAGQRSWAASQEPRAGARHAARATTRVSWRGTILHGDAAFVHAARASRTPRPETAAGDDCVAGVHALADVLEEPGMP